MSTGELIAIIVGVFSAAGLAMDHLIFRREIKKLKHELNLQLEVLGDVASIPEGKKILESLLSEEEMKKHAVFDR